MDSAVSLDGRGVRPHPRAAPPPFSARACRRARGGRRPRALADSATRRHRPGNRLIARHSRRIDAPKVSRVAQRIARRPGAIQRPLHARHESHPGDPSDPEVAPLGERESSVPPSIRRANSKRRRCVPEPHAAKRTAHVGREGETCGDLWYSRKVRKDGKHDASDDWLSLPAGLHEVAETPAADTRRARKKKF